MDLNILSKKDLGYLFLQFTHKLTLENFAAMAAWLCSCKGVLPQG